MSKHHPFVSLLFAILFSAFAPAGCDGEPSDTEDFESDTETESDSDSDTEAEEETESPNSGETHGGKINWHDEVGNPNCLEQPCMDE